MARQGTGGTLKVIAAMAALGAAIWTSQVIADGGLEYRSAWECDVTKFNWYCEAPPEQKDNQSAPKAQKPKSKEDEALERLAKWKRELEGKRALSVLDPTPENVKAYIEAQEKLMQTASVYSDVWRRVIWQNPELNYELKRPVNNAAIEVQKQVRKEAELRTLQDLAGEWGIFFFFRSDCPFCHRMSATLKLMTELYGVAIFPVSLDGGTLPEYPQAKRDNGMASMLGVTQVPMLVLGNVKDRRMIPLGSGVISIQDIIERIYVLTRTKPGELY